LSKNFEMANSNFTNPFT